MNWKSVCLATKNRHKIEEITSCLKLFAEEIVSFNDLEKLPEVDETGKTFEENAYLKAKKTSIHLAMPCLADDSGLVIPALNGEPGIYSARYAGENATDKDRMEKVLKELQKKTGEKRKAHFVCVLLLFEKIKDQEKILIGRGEVFGRIADSIRGDKGFGYDLIFIPNGYKNTFAELGIAIKNNLSHRRRALDSLMEKL